MTWQIDKKDIVLLAAYLGGDTLIGVEDPFFGWLAEQVEEQWPKTTDSLLRAGIVTPDGSNGLAIIPDVKTAIEICCRPQRFISIGQYGKRKSKTTINIERNRYAVIEESDTYVKLSLYDTESEDIRSYVTGVLDLPINSVRFLESTTQRMNTDDTNPAIESANKTYPDSVISDMLSDPENKTLIVIGDYKLDEMSIRSFGIYVKTERILRLDESNNGSLNMRSVTTDDVIADIMR